MHQRQLTTYQAVISQARAFRALRSFMAKVLDKHNLTVTEWLIIGTVVDGGPQGVRISVLAQTLGVEMPVVTNLVHKATANGWVTSATDSSDKRAKLIVATPRGMDRACDIEGELHKGTKQWLGNVDAGMMRGYFSVVDTLAEKEAIQVR